MKKPMAYHPAGLALGITAGIVYALCALFVVVFPGAALRMLTLWFHLIDFAAIAVAPNITLGTFFTGLASTAVIGYLIGYLFAFMHAKCVAHCKAQRWI
ncbi:hypothetical protein HY492_00185 [Candidatus Woesearchaeota archaeon]|nr:hypothetical protein [Candidatus Woesearchaeota archaeon]